MSKNAGNAREYPWPRLVVLNAINDLVELQKGEVTFDDIPRGILHFSVEMYGFLWEYRFAVEGIGTGRSRVTLEVESDAPSQADKIQRQFALLDSMFTSAGTRASRETGA